MATTNNDPRFNDYKPGTCVECGNELRFASEVENGNLCSNCGPGSLKWQKREEQKNDTDFVRRSEEHTTLQSQHGALANVVRIGIARNFDEQSVADIKAALEESERTSSPSRAANTSNARATEARMAETVNPDDANDSRERDTAGGAEPPAHDAGFQTKDL